MGSMINTVVLDLMTGNQYVFLLSKGLPSLFNFHPSVFYPFILQFFSLRSLGMFCIKRCERREGKLKIWGGVIRESIDKMGWWGTSRASASFLASVSFMTFYFHGWIFVKFRNFRAKCVCFLFCIRAIKQFSYREFACEYKRALFMHLQHSHRGRIIVPMLKKWTNTLFF